jgi:hypothetical protein
VPCMVKIGSVVLEKIFKWPHLIFTFFDYLPLKRTWSFIWKNLNTLYPKMICTKFGSIWPACSGEDF